MPEETQQNQGENAGDAAAVTTPPVNPEGGDNTAAPAADNTQAGNGDGGTGAGEEMITVKKSEYEDYKNRAIAKAADTRPLEGGDGDKGGEGDKGAAAPALDEAKAAEIASAAATKTLRDAAEKSAKRTFLKNHPEYLDDNAWVRFVSHLTFKGGEVTQEDILDRMEAALLEDKRSTGQLDKFMQEERERGIREGRIQEQIESGAGTGGAGDRTNGGGQGGGLSAKGEEMAQRMHVDPQKAAKVDPQKDNEIVNP